MSMFTVRIANSLLGSTRYCGRFSALEDAVEYARKEAARSRSFATFAVCTGSPQHPGSPVVGHTFTGEQ